LEKLVENLAKEGESKFEYMTDYFGDEKIKLLLRKQVYPYEYFDSESKFTEKQLPPTESFYSSLSGWVSYPLALCIITGIRPVYL
jgi:hypothetical protein